LADAIDLHSISAVTVRDALLPLAWATEGLPSISLDVEEVERIRRGQSIIRPRHGQQCEVAAFDPQGNLCAIVLPRGPDQLGPSKVLLDE
jgi:hypothetical protein